MLPSAPMCELFCLSSRKPTRASFSLRHFAAHGAATTGNVDGWGVAFHEGHEVRLYKEPDPAHRFHPVGQTDSESAFCLLLERMAPLWHRRVPPPGLRLETIASFAAELRPLGTFNFLYCDGEFVFGHGHRRRQADDTVGPGLWFRHKHRMEHGAHEPEAGVTFHPTDGAQEMSLLASVPVTAGHWRPLTEGEIVVLAAGELAATTAQ